MYHPITKILLVEDNPGDACLIREMLAETGSNDFELEWVSQLSEGLERISVSKVDLVLLDLGLPDSQGIDTFFRAYAHAPEVPFVLMTGLKDETLALAALRQGAQDYLVKGTVDARALLRTIRYATESKRSEEALLESEKRFRDVADNAHEWVWEVDAEGKYTYTSPIVEKLLGYKPEEILGKHFYDLFTPEEREKFKEMAFATFAGKQPFRDFINWNLHKDGSIVCFSTSGVPILDKTGNLLGYRGADIDITERKKAEEALRESEHNLHHLASQLLTAQEQERERISRELHDELGQSLLVLKLQTGQIEDNLYKNPAKAEEECREIMANLDQLVDNVRCLSRDLSPAVLNDLGLSLALQCIIKEFAKRHSIQADFNILPGLETLFSREAQLNIYRICQESLTNIGKYAKASSLKVSVSQKDNHVFFLIADNGRGFAVEKVLARESTVRGLGLTSMKERVRMLGGSLDIWSQEGQGTKISFTLPIDRD